MKIAPDRFDPRYFSIPFFLGAVLAMGFIFLGEILLFVIGIGLLFAAIYIVKNMHPSYTLEYDENSEKVILECYSDKNVFDIRDVVSVDEKKSIGGYWPYRMIHYDMRVSSDSGIRDFRFVIFGNSKAQLKDIELFQYLVLKKQNSGEYEA